MLVLGICERWRWEEGCDWLVIDPKMLFLETLLAAVSDTAVMPEVAQLLLP